jgi:shikimate kinase
MTVMLRPPLLLTGPPAVGKSSVARLLAARRPRCAVVEVDDLRQLVKTGGVAPWIAGEGESQHRLAAENACLLAKNFIENGFEVLISDVVLAAPADAYRHAVPAPLIVRLDASLAETLRRAGTRPHYLTSEEFERLHSAALAWPFPDVILDTENMSREEIVDAVDRVWRAAEDSQSPPRMQPVQVSPDARPAEFESEGGSRGRVDP